MRLIAEVGESEAHRLLKRLALQWAQAHGYCVAAPEVSLPSYRVRADVAAYRPERVRASVTGKNGKPRTASRAAVGLTAIFECKVSKPDFRRDARSLNATMDRLRRLHEQKSRIEHELCVFYPSIRNGDSLFSEYETLNFERPGYERYQAVLASISQLTTRLYMDFLRTEGEMNFFAFLPLADRQSVHDRWYRGADRASIAELWDTRAYADMETAVRYTSGDPLAELYGMMKKRAAPVSSARYTLAASGL